MCVRKRVRKMHLNGLNCVSFLNLYTSELMGFLKIFHKVHFHKDTKNYKKIK